MDRNTRAHNIFNYLTLHDDWYDYSESTVSCSLPLPEGVLVAFSDEISVYIQWLDVGLFHIEAVILDVEIFQREKQRSVDAFLRDWSTDGVFQFRFSLDQSMLTGQYYWYIPETGIPSEFLLDGINDIVERLHNAMIDVWTHTALILTKEASSLSLSSDIPINTLPI